MDHANSAKGRDAARKAWNDWRLFLLLVLPICAGALWLAVESMYPGGAPPRNFLAVAHWFDPVFFQYNLVMLLVAVLAVPCVTLSYVRTMMGRKERRLEKEIPEGRLREIPALLESRASFHAYFGSVALTTAVVLLGASIILIFKPSPTDLEPGVDFSKGANFLMMGPFTRVFLEDFPQYYAHLTRSLTAFQFGFLGAYIYFIGSLGRAFFTLDLTPQTFVDGTFRMMGASILALVLSFVPVYGDLKISLAAVTEKASPEGAADKAVPPPEATKANAPREDKSARDSFSALKADKDKPPAAPESASAGAPAEDKTAGAKGPVQTAKSGKDGEKSGKDEPLTLSLLPVVSFFFGFYPKRAHLFLEHMVMEKLKGVAPDRYRALRLSMLAGMSYNHEARLEREGLDNLENLGMSDPVALAVRTGFRYPQLEQWIEEAWLAMHLREDYAAFVARTGITSRAELKEYLFRWDDKNVDAVEHLAKGIADDSAREAQMAKLAALATLLKA